MSRPLKSINPDEIVEYAAKGCTGEHIAQILNISQALLYRRFKNALNKGRTIRNSSIQQRQVERALNGSDTMLIWLGKQFLDQTDKREVTNNVNVAMIPKPELDRARELAKSLKPRKLETLPGSSENAIDSVFVEQSSDLPALPAVELGTEDVAEM